jgi:hypothetical protein
MMISSRKVNMRDVSEDYVEVNLEQELCESYQNPEQASENIE